MQARDPATGKRGAHPAQASGESITSAAKQHWHTGNTAPYAPQHGFAAPTARMVGSSSYQLGGLPTFDHYSPPDPQSLPQGAMPGTMQLAIPLSQASMSNESTQQEHCTKKRHRRHQRYRAGSTTTEDSEPATTLRHRKRPDSTAPRPSPAVNYNLGRPRHQRYGTLEKRTKQKRKANCAQIKRNWPGSLRDFLQADIMPYQSDSRRRVRDFKDLSTSYTDLLVRLSRLLLRRADRARKLLIEAVRERAKVDGEVMLTLVDIESVIEVCQRDAKPEPQARIGRVAN
jgi:hypothetical protein